MKRALLVACLLLGCGNPEQQLKMQTGPVEVLQIRRFSCYSDYETCKTDLTLRDAHSTIWVLHLERDASQPPVWKGERCNITYIQVPGSEHMRILWATELR